MDPEGFGSPAGTAEIDPVGKDDLNPVQAAVEHAKTVTGESEQSADDKQSEWFKNNMEGTSDLDDDIDLDNLGKPESDPKSTDDDSEAGEKAATDPESDEFKRAVKALKRDGVPQKTLDEMLKNDPETVLEWGGSRADAQSETDGFGRKLDELKEQVAEKNPATKKDTESPEDSEPFDAAKSDARLGKAAEPLSALLGLEHSQVAPALGQYGHALTKEIISAVVPALESQRKEISQLQDILQGMQVADIRSGLVSVYGDAASKQWSKIDAETEGMRFKQGETPEQFYERAARAVLGDPPAKTKSQKDTTAMRNNGTASASSSRSRSTNGQFKPAGHGKDPDIVWLAARSKNKSVEESNLLAFGNREGRRNT